MIFGMLPRAYPRSSVMSNGIDMPRRSRFELQSGYPAVPWLVETMLSCLEHDVRRFVAGLEQYSAQRNIKRILRLGAAIPVLQSSILHPGDLFLKAFMPDSKDWVKRAWFENSPSRSLAINLSKEL